VQKFNPPTIDELVSRATQLLPLLRARAASAEQNRRLHDDTFQQMQASGFGRICQPTRFGGYGLGLDSAIEVVMELGRACGSAAWLANLMSIHNFQVSLFPLQAQEEYFSNATAFCATVSRSTSSTVTEEAGGVRLSGRWKFASGADFADWFIIMRPSNSFSDWLLVPRKDVELIDEWSVSGLCATGSQDILLRDVYVPSHRRLGMSDIQAGTSPGAKLYADPFYRVPFYTPAPLGICAALLGMVTGIADEFQQSMPSRRMLTTGQPQSERSCNQAQLAETHTTLLCARHLLRGAASSVRMWGLSGTPTDPAELLIPRRNYCYAARLATEIAHKLFLASGAGAVYLSNPIQRLTRDAYAAGTHAALNWDEVAELYGKAKWPPSESVS
jgi:alkylation response protein AidB-like acyl-CoA dehydrogenase